MQTKWYTIIFISKSLSFLPYFALSLLIMILIIYILHLQLNSLLFLQYDSYTMMVFCTLFLTFKVSCTVFLTISIWEHYTGLQKKNLGLRQEWR